MFELDESQMTRIDDYKPYESPAGPRKIEIDNYQWVIGNSNESNLCKIYNAFFDNLTSVEEHNLVAENISAEKREECIRVELERVLGILKLAKKNMILFFGKIDEQIAENKKILEDYQKNPSQFTEDMQYCDQIIELLGCAKNLLINQRIKPNQELIKIIS